MEFLWFMGIFMEYDGFQWPFQQPIHWRYLPHRRLIVPAYARNIPIKYGQVYGTNVPPFYDPGIPIE